MRTDRAEASAASSGTGSAARIDPSPGWRTRASWRESLSGAALLGFVALALALTGAGVWVCVRSFAAVL